MPPQISIYVGPYLKCRRREFSADLPDDLQDLIANGTPHPEFDFIGPNIEIKGVDRQMIFDSLEENAVTPIDSIVREMALFETQFSQDIREIRGDYESIEVCWGVVPGWF